MTSINIKNQCGAYDSKTGIRHEAIGTRLFDPYKNWPGKNNPKPVYLCDTHFAELSIREKVN